MVLACDLSSTVTGLGLLDELVSSSTASCTLRKSAKGPLPVGIISLTVRSD
jgi:hypothetical protein